MPPLPYLSLSASKACHSSGQATVKTAAWAWRSARAGLWSSTELGWASGRGQVSGREGGTHQDHDGTEQGRGWRISTHRRCAHSQ